MGYAGYQPKNLVAAAPPGAPLFQWNETDTTQFEATPAFTSGGWVPTLTAVANSDTDCPSDNVLRLEGHGVAAGAGGRVVWLAKDPLALAGDDRSFQIDYLATNNRQASGFAIMADLGGGGLHCMTFPLDSVSTPGDRIDAGAIGAPAVGVNPMFDLLTAWTYLRVTVRGRKVVGTPPEFAVDVSCQGRLYSTADDQYVGYRRIFRSGYGAPPSSWDNLNCLRWGLTVGAFNASDSKIDIGKLRIKTI